MRILYYYRISPSCPEVRKFIARLMVTVTRFVVCEPQKLWIPGYLSTADLEFYNITVIPLKPSAVRHIMYTLHSVHTRHTRIIIILEARP